LSQHTEEVYIRRALEAGVSGYLPKNISKYELINAIHTVSNGESYLSPAITKTVIGNFMRKTQPTVDEPREALSKREREVLSFIMQGLNSQEIGEKLFISPRTVESHRANIMEKLKVKNIIELIKFVRERLLEPVSIVYSVCVGVIY